MRLFFSMVVVFFAASSFAQGTLIFNNRHRLGDAPVSRSDNGMGVGAGFTAQLYLQTAPATWVPLFPTTTFRTFNSAAMYHVVEINPFTVEGVLPGQPATLKMVVWDTSAGSYERAIDIGVSHGESNSVTIPQLGGPLVEGRPDLSGMQGFVVQIIPEPSTLALGILGSATLLLRRRDS